MLSIDRLEGGIVQDSSYTTIDSVVHIAVDGTHSSGITTLIDRFLYGRDLETPDGYDFGRQVKSQSNQKYRFYGVIEHVHDRMVPIVVSSEVARQYDAWHLGEDVLTDGYNLHDQAAITNRGFGEVQAAAMYAASFAKLVQPESAHRVAAILTDRTALSGFAYAEAVEPEANHDYLDLALNATIDGLAESGGGYINLRQQVEELTSYCDLAVIPNYHEVLFEDDGKRKTDTAFRADIAHAVLAAYKRVVGNEKTVILSGDTLDRQTHFEQLIHDVISRSVSLVTT